MDQVSSEILRWLRYVAGNIRNGHPGNKPQAEPYIKAADALQAGNPKLAIELIGGHYENALPENSEKYSNWLAWLGAPNSA